MKLRNLRVIGFDCAEGLMKGIDFVLNGVGCLNV